MRAEKNVRDAPARRGDVGLQPPVHIQQSFQSQYAAVDCRLVGEDDKGISGSRQPTQGRQTPRQKIELCPALNVSRGVTVDDPVTVEENDLITRTGEFQWLNFSLPHWLRLHRVAPGLVSYDLRCLLRFFFRLQGLFSHYERRVSVPEQNFFAFAGFLQAGEIADTNAIIQTVTGVEGADMGVLVGASQF